MLDYIILPANTLDHTRVVLDDVVFDGKVPAIRHLRDLGFELPEAVQYVKSLGPQPCVTCGGDGRCPRVGGGIRCRTCDGSGVNP